MDEKLTRKSQEALSAAVRRAAADGHPQVGPAHLLAALIEQAGGTAAPLLRAVGADPSGVLRGAQDLLGRLPKVAGATASAPAPSATTQARSTSRRTAAATSTSWTVTASATRSEASANISGYTLGAPAPSTKLGM